MGYINIIKNTKQFGANADYSNFILLFILSVCITLLLFIIAYMLSFEVQLDREKLSEYECGFEPFDNATRQTFDIQYYIVGILFLIFDVEIALFFPWVNNIQQLHIFEYYIIVLFVLIVSIGFYYEWYKGALDWPLEQEKKSNNSIWLLAGLESKEIWPSYVQIAEKGTSFMYELEFFLLITVFVILFIIASSSFAPKANLVEKKIYVTQPLIIFSLYICVLCGLDLLYNAYRLKFMNYAYMSSGISTRFIVFDYYSIFFKFLIVSSLLLVMLLSINYIYKHTRHLMEYGLLLILTSVFLCFLVAAHNLVTVLFGIMGFSLNIYVLLLTDTHNYQSREASIKYFYLSAISSGFISISLMLVYFFFTDTNYFFIQNVLQNWVQQDNLLLNTFSIKVMLYFLIVGSFFKLAVFPCHLWSPDVYSGSPHVITFFLIVPIKITIFVVLMRLLTVVFNDLFVHWQFVLYLSILGSLIYGALLAVNEKEIKRFWAYSSINQMGLLLLGLISATKEGINSVIFFLLLYVLSNILFFIFLLLTRNIRTNNIITFLSDFYIGSKNNTLVFFVITILFFSLAGIPPLAGFFAKLFVLMQAISSKLHLLTIIVLLLSLITTFYYVRIIKIIWFDNYTQISINKYKTKFYSSLKIVFISITVFLLFYTVLQEWFLDFIVSINVDTPDLYTSNKNIISLYDKK